MTRDRVRTLLCLLVVEAIPAWVMLDLRPPVPPGGEAPTTEFSAARMLEHVRAFSTEPHPVGTAAHGSVRDYLCGEPRRLGIDPEVQKFGENPPFENVLPPQAAYLTFLAFAPTPALAWLSTLGWSILVFELFLPLAAAQLRVNGTSRTLPQGNLRVG